MNKRELIVDGTDPISGLFQGADKDSVAPFVIFDADAQHNIAGPFNSHQEAEKHRQEILAGIEPRMNVKKLREWITRIDECEDLENRDFDAIQKEVQALNLH